MMLGRLATRRPWWVVTVSAIVLVIAAAIGAGAIDAMSLNRFEAAGSESMHARQALATGFHTGSPNVALLVTAQSGTIDSPDVVAAGKALTAELAAYPGVGDAWSYWTSGSGTLR